MKSKKSDSKINTRREFIRQTSVIGSALMLAEPSRMLAVNQHVKAP
jgi:hypothetical protein